MRKTIVSLMFAFTLLPSLAWGQSPDAKRSYFPHVALGCAGPGHEWKVILNLINPEPKGWDYQGVPEQVFTRFFLFNGKDKVSPQSTFELGQEWDNAISKPFLFKAGGDGT
ncbi:MAG: hypothetical protein Q7S00_06260 [bacterium]|nr:hypothetical protein [bacterium]